MFTLLEILLGTLLAPAMLGALGIWILFAIIGLVFKFIGWTIRVAFKVFVWLFIGSLLFGLVGLPTLAAIVAICSLIWGCSHTARV